MDLFSSEIKVLSLPNAEMSYTPNFYDREKANHYLNFFIKNIPWQQDNITIFGKTHKQPRLTSLFASNDLSYCYSNIKMTPHPFTSELLQIKKDIEIATPHDFTTVLLNLYRNGNDSNGWHADNEKELGTNPTIASLSFGAPRQFHIKHRLIKNEKHRLILDHGSLLVMKGEMQHYWLHQIPKTKREIGERINLTFRQIL